VDNTLFCQHHLLWLGLVWNPFKKKPEKTHRVLFSLGS
jgi:hypothetical protein